MWLYNGWEGGRISNCSVELWECLLSTNMIGVRLACVLRRLLAVDHNAPVMWRAAICWTLASSLMKPTEPEALLPGLVWQIEVYHISATWSILGMVILW